MGYFGASTGAGAALWAAAEPDARVAAVVSRGGRPDLAAPRLKDVRVPTLLVVGGADDVVLELNRQARDELLVARASSPWFPARPTSSRSPAPSRRPRCWPATGSRATSCRRPGRGGYWSLKRLISDRKRGALLRVGDAEPRLGRRA